MYHMATVHLRSKGFIDPTILGRGHASNNKFDIIMLFCCHDCIDVTMKWAIDVHVDRSSDCDSSGVTIC